MGSQNNQPSIMWENDEVRADVPYSVAGVSTSIVILSKFTGKMMILDTGDGLLRDLVSTGAFDFVEELTLIAITHGHFDHSGGLFSLLGFLRMLGRTTPLDILAPQGCSEVWNTIRSFRDSYSDTLSFEIRYHEVTQFTEFDTDFFKVRVFNVEHYGLENPSEEDIWMPAAAYRVSVGITDVAFTGDSRMCTGLEDAVKDADVAFIEATKEKTPETGRRVHLSRKEAEKIGALAKEYRLVHRLPGSMRKSAD
ncbi:MAG: MBL fold metallo-hydrolase [Candidatus Thorarchaeota archaeon]